ncbi:hypothetical protein BaRGS_00036431, partial [Batillaria attramentaria]
PLIDGKLGEHGVHCGLGDVLAFRWPERPSPSSGTLSHHLVAFARAHYIAPLAHHTAPPGHYCYSPPYPHNLVTVARAHCTAPPGHCCQSPLYRTTWSLLPEPTVPHHLVTVARAHCLNFRRFPRECSEMIGRRFVTSAQLGGLFWADEGLTENGV